MTRSDLDRWAPCLVGAAGALGGLVLGYLDGGIAGAAAGFFVLGAGTAYATWHADETWPFILAATVLAGLVGVARLLWDLWS